MNDADMPEHPSKMVDQLKDTLLKKEKTDRYSLCFVENVIKACDELYQYSLMYMDPSSCHEMVIFLQSIAYDFVALNEWFKLKTVCKDLPPPVRTSISPSRVSRHLKKLSRSQTLRRAKSEPRLNKLYFIAKEDENINISKTAGVNVSAPDFVPSYSSEPEVDNSWNYHQPDSGKSVLNSQSMHSNIDPKPGLQSHFYSNSSSDYHECERHLNTVLSYSQNMLPPNFWHYTAHMNLSPFQHPAIQLPHHYVPHLSHIPVPYSVYTNGTGSMYQVNPIGNVVTEQIQCSINSGMNHSFTYSTGDGCFQALNNPEREKSEENRSSSSLSENSDIVIICNKGNVSHLDSNIENENISSTSETNNKKNSEDSLTEHVLEISDKFSAKNVSMNGEQSTSIKSLNKISSGCTEHVSPDLEPLPPDKSISEPCAINKSPSAKEITSPQSKGIMGLGEDECQLHFPELKPIYSQSRQKCRYKTNSKLKSGKISFDIIDSANSDVQNNKSSELVSGNSNEEKATFSKLFKSSPTIEKKPIRVLPNTNKKKAKSPMTSGALSMSSAALKQGHSKILKEKDEKIKKPISNCTDEENNDSDGWETVKVRSKWRDQNDFRQTRINKTHPYSNNLSSQTVIKPSGKSFCDLKLLQYCNSSLSNVPSALGVDSSKVLLKTGDTDKEQFIPGLVEYKATKDKQKVLQGDVLVVKTSNVDKLIKKGRGNSLGNAFKVDDSEKKLIESELPSNKSEKIDPNEMYTAYMQYINNVDEESKDTETKLEKSILHPDAGEENPQSVASLEEMTDFVNRDPIRALEFKKKLANEIKHQEDVKKRNEVKQQQAQKKRLQFLQCKTAKVREFVQKVEEVKAAQHQLALQRKSQIDLKLKKAEENRNLHLSIIKRKAHDEEEKLKEIAFINELEAQNRRHDSLALRQEHEERLQYLVEERQRKLEEKAAREAAVEERRRVLEAERQEKLEKMKEKRRKKQEIIDRKQQEREQERLEIAREKAREREERLQARQSAQLATVEELQKRIQQKQEESARRHVECIELIRQKAVEIGLHRNTFENVSSYMNVYKPEDLLKTESSYINKDTQEKQKNYQKKRFKKIKSRMVSKGKLFIESFFSEENISSGKDPILEKLLGKIELCAPHEIYLWQDEECSNIDHSLSEMCTILRTNPVLSDLFKQLKGHLVINSLLCTFNNCSHDRLSTFSLKCMIKVVNLCILSCNNHMESCLFIILSNIIVTLLDSLKVSLKSLGSSNKSWEALSDELLKLNSTILEKVNLITDDLLKSVPDFTLRMKDLICYITHSGLIPVTMNLFRASEMDEKFTHPILIIRCIHFFGNLLSMNFMTDELMNTLKTTDVFGTVPLLYEGLMQHITKDGSLPEYSSPIIDLFLKLAVLDLKLFQDILGSEGIALQWRGIASGLMMLCVRKKCFGELLHKVIKIVGYFAINNKKNQTLIQSGKHPTVLQQLVNLPFQYFCDPQHMELLFPTLIACSFHNSTNKAIVENELNYSVLDSFIYSPVGQKNQLIRLLLGSENCLAKLTENS